MSNAAPLAAETSGFDKRWLPLGVVTIGSFMTLLDTSIVNVALPSMIKDFDSTVSEGQLVITVYLLALAVVIPLSGFLGERLGQKRLFMLTMLGFTLSSLLCAMAWDMRSLILFRALQGFGGGMVQPVGMAITFSLITPIERGRFMIVLGLPILMGPILGPTVGGYLVEYVSWRAIFLINVPIGLIGLVAAQALLKETEVKHQLRLDAVGFSLGLIAFPGILLGLSEGADRGWDSAAVITLLTAGSIALVAFIFVELHHKDPMLQLRLFKRPMFSVAVFMTLVTQFCFFGSGVMLPLFLQQAHGLGASTTGLILFPSAIMDFAAILVTGRLYTRFGPRPFAVAGMTVLAITALSLSQINSSTSEIEIAAIASLRGLGMGLAMMPVSTMGFNAVPQELMARATSLQNVLMRIFGSASTAVLTTILVVSLRAHGAPDGASVTTPGIDVGLIVASFSDAFIAMALVACAGIVVAFFLHDDVLRAHWAEQRRGPRAVEPEPRIGSRGS